MIALSLARRLQAAGLSWRPARGDRFVVPDKNMDDDVFVISDMVVEVEDVPTGRVLAFNGITEWALDSVEQDDVVWLPRESQLRDLLGDRFLRLEAMTAGWAVVFDERGFERREVDGDAESAYARALLAVLEAAA